MNSMDSEQINRAWRRMALRHDGRANIAFCDGHVETPKNTKLFLDSSDEALVRWNRDHLPHRRAW
jgi:prepilin-type processing-associated H-X9-DG protein